MFQKMYNPHTLPFREGAGVGFLLINFPILALSKRELFYHAQLLAHFNEGRDAFVEVLGFVTG